MNDQARLPTSLYAVVQWFLAVLFIWVTVHSLSSTVCISALLPSRQPMLVEFWRLKDTDTGEFERALRESSLFKALTWCYAEQIEQEVTTALNKFAPLHRRFRRPSKHVTRWLSHDAINAKRQRHKLERVWKRSGQEIEWVVYRRSCRKTNKLINTSRFKFFHDQLELAADCKERWRILKLLVNSWQSVYVRTANENSNLCTKFSQFFVDKIDTL